MSFTLDPEFIRPFVEGTRNTLKVQCGVEATPTKPYVCREGVTESPAFDIAGIIGITSKTFNGAISLCFPEKTFLAVMGRMLGETYATITKDVEDGAAELTNIIFGAAKRVLNDRGETIQKALPSLVSGKSLRVRHPGASPALVLPFETELGSFFIAISTEPSEGGEHV